MSFGIVLMAVKRNSYRYKISQKIICILSFSYFCVIVFCLFVFLVFFFFHFSVMVKRQSQ